MTDQSRRYPPRQLDPSARTRSFIARRSGAPIAGRSPVSGTGVAMGGGMSSGGPGGAPGRAQTVTALPVSADEAPAGTIYYVQGEDGEDSRAVMVIRKADGTREYRDVIQGANAWPAAYVGQWGSAGLGAGQFGEMRGIAVDPATGDVYVSSDDRIQRFSANGTYISTIATFGSGNGQVNTPSGLFIPANGGNLHIADYGNNRGHQLTTAGAFVRAFQKDAAALPVDAYVDPDGTPVLLNANTGPTELHLFSTSYVYTTTHRIVPALGVEKRAKRMAFDRPSDRLYVTFEDWPWVGAYRWSQVASGTVPPPLFPFGGLGRSNGQFTGPHSIAIDAQGNVYVTDTGNHRVQVFDNNGIFQGAFGKKGAGNGELDTPTALAITDDYVYVADSGNRRAQIFANPVARLRNDGFQIPFIIYDGGTVTDWPNMPAAETEFKGAIYFRKPADLTGMTEFRITANIYIAGAAAATLHLEYSADDGASWADAGTRATQEIAIGSVGNKKGAWTSLAVGVRADVLLRVMGIGGDGVADPFPTNLAVQVR